MSTTFKQYQDVCNKCKHTYEQHNDKFEVHTPCKVCDCFDYFCSKLAKEMKNDKLP